MAKADDADKARQTALAKANDADKARLAAEAKLALAIGPSPSGQFSRRSNAEANGSRASPYEVAVVSTVDCERTCSQSNTCKVYTYNKKSGWCYMYSVADLVPNESYDSGVLWTEGNPVPPIPPRPKPNQLTTGQFSPRSNTEVRSGAFSLGNANSAGDCEQACARSNTCKAYSYNKGVAVCYLYSTYAELMPNELFDSGIRN